MKKFILFMVTVALMVTSVSTAGAWQVNIKNSCNNDVTIEVTGEHMFWKQVDCTVTVGKGKTGTCQLPGAICPFDIQGNYVYDNSRFDLKPIHCMTYPSDICCCWNINVEVIQWGSHACVLQLR